MDGCEILPTGDFLHPQYHVEYLHFFVTLNSEFRFDQFHLPFIVSWKNLNLGSKGLRETNAFEVLRFFRFFTLLTRFDFSSRRDLWANERKCTYTLPPNFGAFMNLHIFEGILSATRFSHAEDAALGGGKDR